MKYDTLLSAFMGYGYIYGGAIMNNGTWDKLDRSQEPTMEMISGFVANPLWDELCSHLEQEYKTAPVIGYSGCKMEGDWDGWNVKYKKAGRSLCTLYPKQGRFIVLLVIGARERTETEYALPFLSPYLQELYRNTAEAMGQKWLAIEMKAPTTLEDVKKLVDIRRNSKKLG